MSDSADGGGAAGPPAARAAPMALPPREAGLHVGPHDSIGVVSGPPFSAGRDGSAERPVTPPAGPSTTGRRTLGNLLDELTWRGMLHAHDARACRRASRRGRAIAGYNGFDPSGPSLHVGHLVPIFGLLQFQRHGGRPVALVGGGTGMIGDPSGRSAERNLLDRETLAANVAVDPGQLERFLDFAAGADAAR